MRNTADSTASLVRATPGPPGTLPPARGETWRWDVNAPAQNGARAPPLVRALKRVSPRPLHSRCFPSSHLGASLVGAEAGAEKPGCPPAGLVHDIPEAETAPTKWGLWPPHGRACPCAGFLKGKGGVEEFRNWGGKQMLRARVLRRDLGRH